MMTIIVVMTARAIVIAIACTTITVAASPQPDAHAAYTEGLKHFREGRFDEAAARFEAAYRADPDPGYLFNIAQAYRLGRSCAKAVEYYQRFLAAVPSPPDAEAVTRYQLEAERCAANADVRSSTSTARVPVIRRWTTWAIFAGISAGAAAGFGIDGYLAMRRRDEYAANSAQHRLEEVEAQDRRYRRDIWITDVGLVATGALAITSLVVFLVRPSSNVAVTPAIGGGAVGVSVSGRL